MSDQLLLLGLRENENEGRPKRTHPRSCFGGGDLCSPTHFRCTKTESRRKEEVPDHSQPRGPSVDSLTMGLRVTSRSWVTGTSGPRTVSRGLDTLPGFSENTLGKGWTPHVVPGPVDEETRRDCRPVLRLPSSAHLRPCIFPLYRSFLANLLFVVS